MLAPHTLLQNRYLVLEKIGHGGMGAVYKATDQRFGSTVALKETFFDDTALRRAFEREAHLLNRLRHPALPRVSDHFTEEQGQFLVMEFIPGEDLSELIEKQGEAFALERVLVWADQLLDALDYLHTHEPPVIHRDIKPQNLKLTSRNQIVLLDFGLAKGTPAALSRASTTGSVFGYSRNYAPLEQMQGTGTDPRSDIYSLAATLYHLLTNTVPPDALTRAMAMVNGHPDPLPSAAAVHAQVTPSVAAVLTKAMQQSAVARYQSAEEMRAGLREAARLIEAERGAVHGSASATTVTGLPHEQATQSIAAQTSLPPQANATRADAPKPTGLAHGNEAATLLNSASDSPSGAPLSAAASVDKAGSVVTRIRTSHDQATRQQGSALRAIGIAASLFILLALAGAFYAYTRREEVKSSDQTQPLQEAAATPEPQASPQPMIENAQPTPAPALDASASVSPTPDKQSSSPKVVKRAEVKPVGEGPPKSVEPSVVVAQPETPETPEPLDAQETRGLSPAEREEMRRLPRRIRRMLIEQRRARMIEQRRMEEERRRRRRQQAPPYPPE